MTTTRIRVPGKDDDDILTELKRIAEKNALDTTLKDWIEKVYEKKVEGYLENGKPLAPFATPGNIIYKNNTITFFTYRKKLFSGIIIDAGDADAVKFKKDTIKQHMVNGTTRKFVDNGNGRKDQPITDSKSWPNADNEPFWDDKGKTPFYERVPDYDILVEEQYYPLLKPYFRYVQLANKYNLESDDTIKSNLIKQIGALFFESARKVQPNGKLPKYKPQDSHPIPGLPNITRVNKDKIKVYWDGCKHHSYWVKIGYGDTAVWKAAREITGTSILVDAKGQKLHVALAFARYKPMTNNVAVPAPTNDPNTDSKDWSYRVFPLGPSTALPENVVTTQLFDIDRFRLQLDQQYPDITIFDILQIVSDSSLPQVTANMTLDRAMVLINNFLIGSMVGSIFDQRDYDFVKWEHIDIPIAKNNTTSWENYSYAQKVLIIHRSRIFDTRDQMSIYNIPSVVLDPDEYSRPAKYASVLGKRSNDPDFDVVDRAIQGARTKEYFRVRPDPNPGAPTTDNILNKPWQQAKHHFKVHERGRGTFFADFIYLNNRRETEACKRLRATRRSLDLSNKVGVPVIPKKITAPFPYVSNASSKRSTTFGINNYDRMQSYPAVQELPRTFVPTEIPGYTERGASTASLLPINKKLRSATFYNMRVISGSPNELPHPGYPTRAKANAWKAIVNKIIQPTTTMAAIREGAALINDKPIVLEL